MSYISLRARDWAKENKRLFYAWCLFLAFGDLSVFWNAFFHSIALLTHRSCVSSQRKIVPIIFVSRVAMSMLPFADALMVKCTSSDIFFGKLHLVLATLALTSGD